MRGDQTCAPRHLRVSCGAVLLASGLVAPAAESFTVLDLIPTQGEVLVGVQNAIAEVRDRIPKYENNTEPLVCQGAVGGTWIAAGTTSKAASLAPTPALGQAIKFGADTSAYVANMGLKLCSPMIAPPEPLHVVPSSTDPCNGVIHQPVTQTEYENWYGIPKSRLFSDLEDELYNRGLKNHSEKTIWGDLGRPAVYNFNTAADVRLLDPAKEAGAEDDAWLPDADGNITLPVGRNVVTWRADTIMPLVDLVPLYLIPLVVPGDKIVQKLVMRRPKLSEYIYTSYGRLTRYGDGGLVPKLVTKFITKRILDGLEEAPKTLVEKILSSDRLVPTNKWRASYLTGLRFIGEENVGANSVGQEVWVFDFTPPTLETSKDPASFPPGLQSLLSYDPTTDTYYLEAFAPRIPDASVAFYGKQLLSAHDECQGSRPPLDPQRVDVPLRTDWVVGDQGTLQWQVADDGPNLSGDSNFSPVVDQKFQVRDSNPPILIAPPSRVVEIPVNSSNATVALSSPRVFDLADLTPTISNDAPGDLTFDLGINTVNWIAMDDSGNTDSKQQLINVKVEGTNSAPIAHDQTVSAISSEPWTITLTAFDPDFDANSGRFDPLSFTIKDKPQHGFFIGPLLPYFIDDYRLEASALRFAGDPAQVDPGQYCNDLDQGSVTGPGQFQMQYPYTAEWFNVDDDGTTVVYDQGRMSCGPSGDLESRYRLVAFDAAGELVHVTPSDVSSTIQDIYIDWRSKAVYAIDNPDPGAPNQMVFYDKELNNLGNRNVEYVDGQGGSERITGEAFITSDSRGIVYVGGRQPNAATAVVAYQGPVSDGDVAGATYPLLGVVIEDSNMRDIAVDATNHLYISKADRILKYAPAALDDDGNFVPSALIGWLGRCVSNLTNTFACDVTNQRSLGFSCTDALCGTSGNNFGSEPMQFNDARGIAIDPNDILYVSDYGNSRVQRFTPDGDFAGQAVSTGVGYGFILGDFGRPEDITVNSDHFYILNNNLLHVLETTPVTPVDDTSARVTYQSNDNFVGTDSFTFEATDGLASDIGTVTVNVERNYRPPVISVPPSYTVVEDDSVQITLVGSDPDGSLDTLNFTIVDPPRHGVLSGAGASMVYTPEANYSGEDNFSYLASDGVFESAPAMVNLTITAAEDPPQVTTEAAVAEGLGFRFQFPVEVFDPDSNENLKVTIDWGDGAVDTDGVVMQNGAVVTADYTPPDSATSDDLEATGPVLDLDEYGNGIVVFEHAYAAPGDHIALVCVTDRVETLDDGSKQATAGSQTACTQTTFSVTLYSELLLLIVSESEEVDPGASQKYTITVINRPFDVDVPGTPQGLDTGNVVVTGESDAGVTLIDMRPDRGACTHGATTFSCRLGLIEYGETATIEVDGNVDALAAGNALLSITANRTADSVAMLEDEAIGVVLVNTSGNPPRLDSLSSSIGSTIGGQTLTISGRDFDMDADVLFDDMPASDINVVDTTTITLTTPAHREGVVDVVVINSDNQSSALAQGFQYFNVLPVGGGGGPGGRTGSSKGGGGSLDAPSVILLLLFSMLTMTGRRKRWPGSTAFGIASSNCMRQRSTSNRAAGRSHPSSAQPE